MIFVVLHLYFIIDGFRKRAYELSKLLMDRNQVKTFVESHQASLEIPYDYRNVKQQMNNSKQNTNDHENMTFHATEKDELQINFCGIEMKLQSLVKYCFCEKASQQSRI